MENLEASWVFSLKNSPPVRRIVLLINILVRISVTTEQLLPNGEISPTEITLSISKKVPV